MTRHAVEILRAQFKAAHDWLEGTVGEIGEELAHWKSDGNPSPIGAQYVHTVTTEDFFVNALQGKPPLMAGEFAGKVGINERQPAGGEWAEWALSVKVDMKQARTYAQAVYANTNALFDSVDDDWVIEEVDMSQYGFGTEARAYALSIILLNTFSHTGEISALKGMQGEKGYPF